MTFRAEVTTRFAGPSDDDTLEAGKALADGHRGTS